MTAPVDVLAVLDRLSYALQDRAGIAAEVKATRDAVAELIAAAERGQSLVESGAIRARQSEQDAVAEWADMLDAALAACKPATGAEK